MIIIPFQQIASLFRLWRYGKLRNNTNICGFCNEIHIHRFRLFPEIAQSIIRNGNITVDHAGCYIPVSDEGYHLSFFLGKHCFGGNLTEGILHIRTSLQFKPCSVSNI